MAKKLDLYDDVYLSIKHVLENSRNKAFRAVNSAMVKAYWEIGRIIVEEEQKGKKRADYGSFLLKELSLRLTKDYGKGFNEQNLRNFRQFYIMFQKRHALRGELTWTHYRLLISIGSENARSFYLNECINSNWSTRELERQISSLLFERLALSRNKKKIFELSKKGQVFNSPKDIIKDPYVMEFLDIPENTVFLEKDLEKAIISKLQKFLLELGKGFSFVSRQRRITVDGDHYYVDLVFYNYILKCFFLIDLKIGKLTHADIGQMDFYVRYFEKEVKRKEDNPTVGLILCSDKNDVMVRYTLLSESRHIFASKYRFYLPTEKEIRKELTQKN